MSPTYALALITAPNLKTARKLARGVLEARLAACVNLVPGLESHYWWQGRLERSQEVLLLLKTTSSHLPGLERLILKLHPYDTPEFIVFALTQGNRRYLDWIRSNVAQTAGRRPTAPPEKPPRKRS